MQQEYESNLKRKRLSNDPNNVRSEPRSIFSPTASPAPETIPVVPSPPIKAEPLSQSQSQSLSQSQDLELPDYPEPGEVIEISPAPDVRIIVPYESRCKGRTAIEFQVSAGALMCSPVFQAMLGPQSQFSEAIALRKKQALGKIYSLRLEDDDPTALLVILYALHMRHADVPTSLAGPELVQIATTADKYDLSSALKTYYDIWTAPIPERAQKCTATVEQWIFIGWVFRCKETFTGKTKAAIDRWFRHAGTPSPFRRDGVALPIPASVLREIDRRRREALARILELCKNLYQIYERMLLKVSLMCHTCKGQCTHVIFGVMHRTFKDLGILDFDLEAQAVDHLTIEMLMSRLRAMEGEIVTRAYPGETAKGCNPWPDLLWRAQLVTQNIKGLELEGFVQGEVVQENMKWELYDRFLHGP